jgi:hypothetical protein
VIVSRLGPYAQLAAVSTDVAIEPTSLLPRFPMLRPADVALRLLPRSRSTTSHTILVDVTAIRMPKVPPTTLDTTCSDLQSSSLFVSKEFLEHYANISSFWGVPANKETVIKLLPAFSNNRMTS